MNIKRYAHEYSQFHNSYSYDLIDDVIVLPFSPWKWDAAGVLRIRYFDKVKSNNTTPLVQAFKVYFNKTDAICSVFLSKDTYSLLIGNEKLVIPESKGSLKLYATPFFVRDPKQIENHALVSRTPFPNVFFYNKNGTILFLDELDVPCPGGNYFNTTGGEYYRLCFLTTEALQSEDFKVWQDVLTLPFFSKSNTISLSSFLPTDTTNDIPFPDHSVKSTAIIDRKHPNFLIQDILNTYMRNGGLPHNLGLFIEYPIRVGYESCNDTMRNKQFLAISVNGNEPKSVLHVQCPYDRYIEYAHVPAVPWSPLLFDPSNVPLDLHRVVVDSMILGYGYRGAFFCLSCPMLEVRPLPLLHTDYLLSPVDFDVEADGHLSVIDSYRYDCHHDLCRVKHRDFPHDLWCLTTIQHIPETYAKRAVAPPFVRQWLSFYDHNKNPPQKNVGDMRLVKLALVLARHHICYSVKAAKYRDISYEPGRDVVFRLDPEAIDYINDVRLDGGTHHKVEESCLIL